MRTTTQNPTATHGADVRRRSTPAAVLLVVALILGAACSEHGGFEISTPTAPAPPSSTGTSTADVVGTVPSNAVPSIAGDWAWQHRTTFVVPTDVAAGIVPVSVHGHLSGPVTKIDCIVSGDMTLSQTGPSFGGTSTQTSDCGLKTGPRFAMPFVFQSPFEVSNGVLTGRALQFNVGAGCLNHGNVRMTGGTATGWRVSGHCEIPIPVQPAVAKTIIWTAERP